MKLLVQPYINASYVTGGLSLLISHAQQDEHQRVIFVMGDMDHLGSQVGQSHRMIGFRAAREP